MEIEQTRPIVANATKNLLFGSICDAMSVRQLKPNCPMDDNLINILPGLVSSVEDSIYLGNKFYPELLKNGYGNTKEWIQEKGQESGRWFFTADVDSGRVVIGFNWYMGYIEYYDPQRFNHLTIKRRDKVNFVSTS